MAKKHNKQGNSDINELVSDLDIDKLQEEHKEAVLSQHNVDADINFETGSIKITEATMKAAKYIVEARMNSTQTYTKKRIDRFNKNFKLYYSNPTTSTGDTLAKKFVPETFNSVQDWGDDLLEIFKEFYKMIEIEEDGNESGKNFVRKLPIVGIEDEGDLGHMRDLATDAFGPQSLKEEDVYYFSKGSAIKAKLKTAIQESGMSEVLYKYFMLGIITGEFVFRDAWLADSKQQLVKTEGDKISFEHQSKKRYTFIAVDPRMIIHPKENKDWVIGKINTTISDLLEIILDENDKPRKNSTYDPKMIKLVMEYTKETDFDQFNKRKETLLDAEELTEEDTTQMIDNWNNEGSLTIYEAHNVPLKIEGKIFKCLVTCVNLTESEDNEVAKEPNLIPIRIQKTPYIIGGHPYHITNFLPDFDNTAGRGLPQVVEPLQQIINDMISFTTDLQNFGLWGMMVVNGDVIKDTTEMKNMSPRKIMKLKNVSRGGSIKDMYDWLVPDTSVINSMFQLLEFFLNYLKKTTRKGPTGEKVSPNPSATELASIVEELQKSVNTTILNINDAFVEMVRRIYIYNMLENKGSFDQKVSGFRLTKTDPVQKIDVEKSIDLDMSELFIEGVRFKIKAAEEFFKKATERQQILQTIKLLTDMQVVAAPTGEKIYVDESGQQVKVSELKLIEKILKLFDLEDVMEVVKPLQQNQAPPTANPAQPGQQGAQPATAGPPPLNASAETANILNSTAGGV